MANIKTAAMLRKSFKRELERDNATELLNPDISFKFLESGQGGLITFLEFSDAAGKTYYTEITANLVRQWKNEIVNSRRNLIDRVVNSHLLHAHRAT